MLGLKQILFMFNWTLGRLEVFIARTKAKEQVITDEIVGLQQQQVDLRNERHRAERIALNLADLLG